MPPRVQIKIPPVPPEDLDDDPPLGLDHFEMPRTVINRTIKAALPESTQVRKDATMALTNCTAVFINYLGQAAQESASDRNRKTVSADDVLSVIGQMGLPPESQQIMQQHLAAFRQAEQAKRAKAPSKGRGSKGKQPAAPEPEVQPAEPASQPQAPAQPRAQPEA